MDFVNRLNPNHQAPRMPASPEQFGLPKPPRDGKHRAVDLLTLGGRIGTNILLVIVALLIAALSWLIYAAQPITQTRYIDNGKLQAVFLNTGQVYFGSIAFLNKDYYVLSNVYYLQSQNSTNAKATSPNLSLIKLGCELHKPYDRMIINSNEVTFWENLQDDGQVGKAVAQFKQQNPSGQKCSTTPEASTTNNLQNSATTGAKSSTTP